MNEPKFSLDYTKSVILYSVFLEIMDDNKDAIQGYRLLLDSEIQKYANRLTVLSDSFAQQKYTKNIEKKIEKCTGKLSIARKNKELFEQDYRSYCMEQKPEPIAKVVQDILKSPFSDLVASTRISGENDFLVIDEKKGNVQLNQANIKLLHEVFREHKSTNLKKLVQIREIDQIIKYSELHDLPTEEFRKKQEEIRSSIDEPLRKADCQAFQRLNYYGATSLRKFGNGYSFLEYVRSEQITDSRCYCNENLINPVFDTLQLIEFLVSVSQLSREDLLHLTKEEEFVDYKNVVQDDIHDMVKHPR